MIRELLLVTRYHDGKNGFHAALALAGIEDFTWHDLRHRFASWLMMRGASLRGVAEAARPPVDENDDALRAPVAGVPVSGSEPARSAAGSDEVKGYGETDKGKKGQNDFSDSGPTSKVPDFVKEIGSPHWTIFDPG